MKNIYIEHADHFEILINSKGQKLSCLVSKPDFEIIASYPGTWCNQHGYAVIRNKNQKKGHATDSMHQILYKKLEGCILDHKNRNKMDNRRGNIRYANFCQNIQNRIFSPFFSVQ